MRHIASVILIAAASGAFASCDHEPEITQPSESAAQRAHQPRYTIVKLPASLGGTSSRGTSINDRGWVAGFSNLPDNQTRHAVVWRHQALTDLQTLGGPNSSVQWPGQNNRGTIVGISETAETETAGEEWSCSAFFATVTHKVCLGFAWENGVMHPLPTLGGKNGFATGVNDARQVVGWAETFVHDPTCNSPQVFQFRAVLWDLQRRRYQELRPFRGDSTSAATAINQRGQVVGISGDCDVAVGRFSAKHAVMWDKGRVTLIDNLGGASWHTPMAINERGDVVGFSNPPGDADGSFIAHAFLWTGKGKIKDLGTLHGDETSQAMGVNSRRQVVGVSSGPNGNRAFLWDNGVMMDLDSLAGPNFADSLVSAQHINDAGQITGRLIEKSSGKTVTFVANPR